MGSQSHPGASPMERARIAAGLTAADVASRLHRSQITVERWEQGKHSPSRDVLASLAVMYGVPAAELVATHAETAQRAAADLVDLSSRMDDEDRATLRRAVGDLLDVVNAARAELQAAHG
jgi:transcriptional regulator with XRE-family HTH domain